MSSHFHRLIAVSVIAISALTLSIGAGAKDTPCKSTLLASNGHRLLSAPHRAPSHAARDKHRNPLKTLDFFGLKHNMTVIEIWPGARGWYTEILAPILREQGTLYAAHFPKDSSIQFFRTSHTLYRDKLKEHPNVYKNTKLIEFNPPKQSKLATPGSADMVLTFRNVHNWIKAGKEQQFFYAFYEALKPGGILGVVEHRGHANLSRKRMAMSGYVSEEYTLELAQNAGFKLVAKSEINANPKDLKAYPEGVWTLPPTLRLKGIDREKYIGIGESDRMTLKFIKPL